MDRSAALYAEAQRVVPGGVHSPARGFSSVGTAPRFMKSAEGSHLRDVDGNRYLDFCMAFGPMIFGHGNPLVRHAIVEAVSDGWSFGTAEPYSLELAQFVTDRIPWLDQVRFVNSGTEAVMAAVRLARAATGRDRIATFAGCYHGHSDSVLAGSSGIPLGVRCDNIVLPLDDEDRLESELERNRAQLAAVIIEPLPANHGLLPQRLAFLSALRELCSRHGIVLIFDEVITGFRLEFGGFAGLSGIEPDLVTYGKVIGGGLPIGAFGGSRELMKLVAPAGPVFQAGTFSANPVVMRASLATLRQLEPEVYEQLERIGDRISHGFADHPDITVVRVGSIFWLHLNAQGAPRSPAGVGPKHVASYGDLFRYVLGRGIYLPPSPLEVGFLSTAHSNEDVDRLIHAISDWHQDRGLLA